MTKIATRFAPSPTGPLHIGGVRTALFNWLYSKNQNGNFFLRVEDTDKERSKEEYKNQIIESLKWIGINYDGEEYIQSQKIENNTIEDFIILRNDGSPTYNLSASVDDHQMNMTHIIRGDDHKINTFKQIQIYQAMKWDLPSFAHIPLIHTIEGKKLSKRDKASTLDDYAKIGIMPDALRNYLLRLGWSYKDKEIFTLDESIKYFNLEGIGRSPSKLDMSRILSMNEHYIKNINENDLFDQFINYCKSFKSEIKSNKKDKIKKSLSFLKNKAKTLEDIFNNGQYIIVDEVSFDKEDIKLIDDKAKKVISDFKSQFVKIDQPSREILETIVNELIKSHDTNFKGIGQPLRIALTGSKFGPGIYDIIISLGKEEIIKRLGNKIFI